MDLTIDVQDSAGVGATDHATLSIPLTVVYNTPSGKANLSVGVSVQITDDRNNQVTASGQASVI